MGRVVPNTNLIRMFEEEGEVMPHPKYIIGDPSRTQNVSFDNVRPIEAPVLKIQKKDVIRPPSPTKSIYEIVNQEINQPEGMLFRGKYVGSQKA